MGQMMAPGYRFESFDGELAQSAVDIGLGAGKAVVDLSERDLRLPRKAEDDLGYPK